MGAISLRRHRGQRKRFPWRLFTRYCQVCAVILCGTAVLYGCTIHPAVLPMAAVPGLY
jgi:hypothetical protein